MGRQNLEDNKHIDARHKEYRPFTRKAATRVAKERELEGKEDALFKLVTGITRTYEQYRLTPDHQQQKDAREKLSNALRNARSVVVRHERTLEQQLEITLLTRELGELLTFEGIERLLGRRVGRRHLPAATPDSYDELTRLDRASHASRAGPKLLIALFDHMQSGIDRPVVPPNKGGHPIKHLHRHAIAVAIAQNYHWFFDERPTTGKTGQFAKLCLEVLDEMECDTTGFGDTLSDVLDDAATNFVPFRGPRSRRKSVARKRAARRKASARK